MPLLLPNSAKAVYLPDGYRAMPSGNGVAWYFPGQCVNGIASNGTMTISTEKQVTDCVAHTFPSVTTGANCTTFGTGGGTTGDGISHYWTSTCVDNNTGAGYSFGKLPMSQANCTSIATAAGSAATYKLACTSSWYVTASAPPAIATTNMGASNVGLTKNNVSTPGMAGFCYSTVVLSDTNNTSTGYGNPASIVVAGTCPTSTVGYSWTTTTPYGATGACTYSYGIAGYRATPLTEKDGVTTVTADSTVADALGTGGNFYYYNFAADFPTQGQCLANGASWNSATGEVPSAGTPQSVILAGGGFAGSTFTYPQYIYASSGQCGMCHNGTDEGNGGSTGPSDNWKEQYLKTGHRNSLRAVNADITANGGWVGASPFQVGGTAYTSDETGSINWLAGTAGSATNKTLFYLIGGWISPYQYDITGNSSGSTTTINVTSTNANQTACFACHTTGYQNAASNTGLCSDSTQTTSAGCSSENGTGFTAGGVTYTATSWIPTTGIQGGAPFSGSTFKGVATTTMFPDQGPLGPNFGTANALEPQNTFATIVLPGTGASYNPRWDFDNVLCSRCHGSFTQVNSASSIGFPMDPWGDKSGSGSSNLPPESGYIMNNMCLGCHMSLATDPASTPTVGATILDPTQIPTTSATAASYADWSGYGSDGNQFLNSPHARFSGTVQPNVTGTYDLGVNTTYASFSSGFQGSYCGSSGLAYYWNTTNSDIEPIATSAECTSASGTWTKITLGAPGVQSSPACIDCHDVHRSLAPEVNALRPLHNECVDCHNSGGGSGHYSGTNSTQLAVHSNHPASGGTPYGIATGDVSASLAIGGSEFSSNLIDQSAACVICHMPQVNKGDVNTHVFRINTSATYSTLPYCSVGTTLASSLAAATSSAACTAASTQATWISANGGHSCSITAAANCTTAGGTWTAYSGTAGDVRALTAPETYMSAGNIATISNAVWVDVDLACGQCHGGSRGSSAVANGAPYFSKATLAIAAKDMHRNSATPSFTTSTALNGTTTLDASATTCPSDGACKYIFAYGDGNFSAASTSPIATYTYGSGPYNATLYVENANGIDNPVAITSAQLVSLTATGTPTTTNTAPQALTVAGVNYTGALAVQLTDASNATSTPATVTVLWGDGSSNSATQTGTSFTHTYTNPGSYPVIHRVSETAIVTNSANKTMTSTLTGSEVMRATVPQKTLTISGTITNGANNAPIPNVTVGYHAIGTANATYAGGSVITNASGNYSFLVAGSTNYTVTASVSGFTFAASPATVDVAANSVSQNFTGTSTLASYLSVSGTVTENTVGVFGAQVILVNHSNGIEIAGGVTDSNGNYSFPDALVSGRNYDVKVVNNTPANGDTYTSTTIALGVVATNQTAQDFTGTGGW